MGRKSKLEKTIEAQIQAAELAAQAKRMELKNRIAAGPPVGSGISIEAWRNWNEYGWIACPRTEKTCGDPQCGMGPSCQAIGRLDGDCTHRPICGARNRQNKPCGNKAVPGKRRCKFHGGMSTGPRTPEGRARIAAAQRARWLEHGLKKVASEISSHAPLGPPTPNPAYVDPYQEADDEMSGESFLTI
jgi:hypothetical protein